MLLPLLSSLDAFSLICCACLGYNITMLLTFNAFKLFLYLVFMHFYRSVYRVHHCISLLYGQVVRGVVLRLWDLE